MAKCIILEKVRDANTSEIYKPKKDSKGQDVPQEVNEEFYKRAKGTKFIKEVELEMMTIAQLKLLADEKGIELKGSMNKAKIIEELRKEDCNE